MRAESNIHKNESFSLHNQYPLDKEIKAPMVWQALMLSLKEEAACDQATD